MNKLSKLDTHLWGTALIPTLLVSQLNIHHTIFSVSTAPNYCDITWNAV